MALDLDPVLTVSAPSKELYPAEKCHVTPPNRGLGILTELTWSGQNCRGPDTGTGLLNLEEVPQ